MASQSLSHPGFSEWALWPGTSLIPSLLSAVRTSQRDLGSGLVRPSPPVPAPPSFIPAPPVPASPSSRNLQLVVLLPISKLFSHLQGDGSCPLSVHAEVSSISLRPPPPRRPYSLREEAWGRLSPPASGFLGRPSFLKRAHFPSPASTPHMVGNLSSQKTLAPPSCPVWDPCVRGSIRHPCSAAISDDGRGRLFPLGFEFLLGSHPPMSALHPGLSRLGIRVGTSLRRRMWGVPVKAGVCV